MTDHQLQDQVGPAILEMADGLRLEMPPEPAELRGHLRDKALDNDAGEHTAYQDCFGAWLWERWRATFEPAGFERELFIEVVRSYRREIWFWLMGDRRWEQVLEGLAGRVSRRLPNRDVSNG